MQDLEKLFNQLKPYWMYIVGIFAVLFFFTKGGKKVRRKTSSASRRMKNKLKSAYSRIRALRGRKLSYR